MRAALLAALLVCAEATAQGRILVAPLPENLNTARILALARESLTARGWSVDADDPVSVAGRSGVARIQLLALPGVVRYQVLRGAPTEDAIAELREHLRAALGPMKVGAITGKTLMGFIPKGTGSEQMLQSTRLALAARRWVVTGSEDVIQAKLKTARASGALVIFMTREGLQYADEGDIPDNWVANLRADIPRFLLRSQALVNRPEPRREPQRWPPSAEPGAAHGAAERLRTLQQLLDSGMITRDEYDKKRVEILKEL